MRAYSHPADFGPAMKALTPLQQRFVIACLELGTTNYTRAAIAAGYKDNGGKSINVLAARLAHNERVIAALNEEAHRRLMASAPMAISELVKIAETEQDKKYKLKAIEMVLNRTGHHATTEHKVEVKHEYSDGEAVSRIFALAKQLQLDPVKLLGSNGVKVDDKGQIIDAVFTEVGEPEIPQEESVEYEPDGEFDWNGE